MTLCPRARLGAARSLPVLLILGFSSAGFVAPAAAVSGRAGIGQASAPLAASSVDQAVLTFANLMPGETARQYLTLTVEEPSPGTVVRADLDGSAGLLPFVVTQLRSCAVPWQAGVCSSGQQTLHPLGAVPASHDLAIPVQARDALYLEVAVGVSDDVPQGTAGTLSYAVTLEGAELVPPTATPSPSPTESPVVLPPGVPPGQEPGQALHPPLARTGAEILATLMAGLSLIGLGAAVVSWARRRRAR
jgi:hypothetical protein